MMPEKSRTRKMMRTRDISERSVNHVTEQDFETTEGESQDQVVKIGDPIPYVCTVTLQSTYVKMCSYVVCYYDGPSFILNT
jgi:hypothetical protein